MDAFEGLNLGLAQQTDTDEQVETDENQGGDGNVILGPAGVGPATVNGNSNGFTLSPSAPVFTPSAPASASTSTSAPLPPPYTVDITHLTGLATDVSPEAIWEYMFLPRPRDGVLDERGMWFE